MILSEFILKVNRWPQMHFTAIESELRGGDIEIYAIDYTNQIKSRMMIYTTPDAKHASAMITHFQSWLEKANRGKTLRQIMPEVPEVSVSEHQPTHR